MYPGIPEYFNNEGRGMYAYLTGAASWYMLTMITEVFGVRGELGNLVFRPKLMAKQFDEKGTAGISMTFAGKKFEITYINRSVKEYGNYAVVKAEADGKSILDENGRAVLKLEEIEKMNNEDHKIVIELD